MTEIRLHFPMPSHDALSDGLRLLTFALHEKGLADGGQGGIFGGAFGYGANFENETFLLHRYCWCERDDCLWCCGSRCQAEIPRRPHDPACYQSRLARLREQYGTREEWGWSVPYDHQEYNAAKKALCRELHGAYRGANETFCTCGADAEWLRRYDACECDWHMGRGRFRFGKAVPAPHFWHKPGGSQIRWYKYIGRDMEGGIHAPWREVLCDCLASIGATLDEALCRRAGEALETDRRSFIEALESAGVEVRAADEEDQA